MIIIKVRKLEVSPYPHVRILLLVGYLYLYLHANWYLCRYLDCWYWFWYL